MDNILIGGDKHMRYSCDHTKQFNNICTKHINGKYKSHTSCVNECEDKYIQYNLQQAGIQHETSTYYKFIKKLLKLKIDVYLKGGNPLGFHILKMILSVHSDRNKFKIYFDKFLELNLIKDWDFHCYTHKPLDDIYKNKLNKIASSLRLVSRAKKLVLYQTKNPIEILDTALFEVAITDKDNYSELESVMSTMKIKITEYNVKYIFMMAKVFYKYIINKEPIDIDIIMRILDKIDVIIYPHSGGYFIIKPSIYNDGGLSSELLNMIDKFREKNKYNPNVKQFLIAHIKEPKRMYFRLLCKNLPKAELTYKFLKDSKLIKNNYPEWLLNVKKINSMITLFTKELNTHIMQIYKKNNIPGVLDFLQNINFKPIRDEYSRFSLDGLTYIHKLLNSLYQNIKDEINNFVNDPNDKGGLILVLKFLQTKGIFN